MYSSIRIDYFLHFYQHFSNFIITSSFTGIIFSAILRFDAILSLGPIANISFVVFLRWLLSNDLSEPVSKNEFNKAFSSALCKTNLIASIQIQLIASKPWNQYQNKYVLEIHGDVNVVNVHSKLFIQLLYSHLYEFKT